MKTRIQRRLVTFGCSNTYGSFLPGEMITQAKPSKYAWPAVLSNKLGIECVNKGIGGASNKLISYVLHNTTLYLSLIHISEPRDLSTSRMPSSA